ncbi:MAG: DUF1156 domain-containing protein [Gammaproteobacteria bacterium]|nr:DUF1156 domain-containing protein [Gammaproteobacteria bacterium]
MGIRLIETAFPLKQASLDSVHEKNVRHGHISTLHIWPARRPLAASRAVLLAALLDDPGDRRRRNELIRRIGGDVVTKQTERGDKEETVGGVLHWGRESSDELARLRDAVRKAFNGRAPRVLDPFAGGGAIPLEAMRLGCEVTASDLNPVAWFILRCTLHYPQLMAGKKRPLPDFALRDREFMWSFFKAQGVTKRRDLRQHLARLGHGDPEGVDEPLIALDTPETRADFAWHLRAWGRRVLDGARRELAERYPTYAEFEPVKRRGKASIPTLPPVRFKPRPSKLLLPDADGRVSAASLNAEFDPEYLEDERRPRWIAKPTVAYLWARTAECGNCRAAIPLLKTRWLCRRDSKRVLLEISPKEDRTGVEFDVCKDIPAGDESALGAGTMNDSGVECPCCDAIATMEDLRVQGRSGRLGATLTVVVVEGQAGKEYRAPMPEEVEAASVSADLLREGFGEVPLGLVNEPMPSEEALGMRSPRYGFDNWRKLFSNRQLLALSCFVRKIRRVPNGMTGYPPIWCEAIVSLLAPSVSRLADRCSAFTSWVPSRETIGHTFARFALPMVWDFAESVPLSDATGGYDQAVEWVARVLEHTRDATRQSPPSDVLCRSATSGSTGAYDIICTDPPYYDAIPYSDLMDFFYVWLRRVLYGHTEGIDAAFTNTLAPKWDAVANDGELIDDASRFGGDKEASKKNYEDGMARAFINLNSVLHHDGRFIIVFANKQPDAWETLVSAVIRAGFVVVGSWPIQTEMQNRQRSLSSAALSSSIWLVCKKRKEGIRPGWDSRVLAQMRANITERLRDFWDAGIRGPDFVWAATGPALESFSKYPFVRITDAPGERMSVAAFLRRVRRMVVAFVVGRLVDSEGGAYEELDDATTYYLLHRNDFGLGAAPSGACILYALSCNLSDAALAGRIDLIARGRRPTKQDDADGSEQSESKTGSEVRLKRWDQRRGRDLGDPGPDGAPPTLIDCLHRLMRLWKGGDQGAVNRYLEHHGFWHRELFAHVVQAVIELAEAGSEERTILESIQNHLRSAGPVVDKQPQLPYGSTVN